MNSDNEKADYSLLSFLFKSTKYWGESAPKGDFATGFAVAIVGAMVMFWFFPIHLLWFIVSNRFNVTTKTWIYLIIILTIIALIGLGSLIGLVFNL